MSNYLNDDAEPIAAGVTQSVGASKEDFLELAGI